MKSIPLLFIVIMPILAQTRSLQHSEIPSSSSKDSLHKFECKQVKLFEKADFPVGVAIDFQKLTGNERYRNLVISQFNSITAEKSMKPTVIHPHQDIYDFSETDYLMSFCETHNKRLHGHTLVWHKGTPRWMEKFKGDKKAWELLLKNHIQTIIKHCKKNVKSWDVLNEAFNDDGSLRENIWLNNMGEGYIEKCFTYAAEADPSAILFYNDFNLESQSEKLNSVLKFLTALKAKGVKIDGIGMQMHIAINDPYLVDINLAAMKIEDRGFIVHYSELDISLVKSGRWILSRDLLTAQGQRMKGVVGGYRKLHAENRFGITIWGLSDMDSWLLERNGNDRPVLFNARYKIKPAYCGFIEALTD